ncbi:hypothetical protein RND81_11G029500 [Saponaria officinalis]|uniref:Uncharacterized protein n=1 Tax=Saponaria officinalis TaxID=3572 RepID=A0AAW1HHF8_SAPOF
MPIYESKCHEELRWEDYELKLKGNSGSPNLYNTVSIRTSSSSFSSQISASALVIPFNITSTSMQNLFFHISARSLNSTPSNIMTPAFNQPLLLFPRNSFPSLAPSSNSTPSSTTTPAFTHASSRFWLRKEITVPNDYIIVSNILNIVCI